MQTLGLDGAPPPQPWYRLWLWPDVTDPEGALSAARLAKRATLVFAAFNLVVGSMQYSLAAALAEAPFYALAAIGIGQLSLPPAAMVLTLFVLTQLAASQVPGILGFAFLIILVNAVRASLRQIRLDPAQRIAFANPEFEQSWEHRFMLAIANPEQQRPLRIVLTALLLAWFALLFSGLCFIILTKFFPLQGLPE